MELERQKDIIEKLAQLGRSAQQVVNELVADEFKRTKVPILLALFTIHRFREGDGQFLLNKK